MPIREYKYKIEAAESSQDLEEYGAIETRLADTLKQAKETAQYLLTDTYSSEVGLKHRLRYARILDSSEGCVIDYSN